MRRLISFVFSLAIIGVIALGGAFFYGKARFEAAGPNPASKIILLPAGSGLNQIANTLARKGVIEDELIFKLGARALKAERSLKAGEYEIAPTASMAEILDLLQRGETVRRKLTFAEGLTSSTIVDLLAAAEALEGETGPIPPEGTLAPDTYFYQRGERREAVLARMRDAQSKALDELWASRVEGLPLSTKEEALVLASIVEKETGVAAERRLVAGVFINRLRRGMRLQSDPTVIYGVTGGIGELGRGIRKSELRDKNPYNTYVINGLPPTPIANPGREAIAAVLNPEETKYLYFVADGTGGHVFAATLADHNRNVAKWRKIERERAAQ